MRRMAALLFPLVLWGWPAAAAGEPPSNLDFILRLPTIVEGSCISQDEDGKTLRLNCEIRAKEKGLWPQERYYLIISADQTVIAIIHFRVDDADVLYFTEK